MLKNRILPIGVLLFVCGTAISVYSDGIILPLCFSALTVSCSLLCAIRFLRLRTSLIIGLLPLAAFLYVNLYSSVFIPHGNSSGNAYVRVTGESSYYSGRQLTATVTSSDTLEIGKGVVFYSPPDESITFGDIVFLEGRFYCLDSSPSRLASGIHYSFTGDSYYTDESRLFFVRLRRTLMEKCDEYLGEYSPVVKAITISDKSDISSSDYNIYSRAGVSHILAVSGLHLTVAVMALYTAIRRITGNKYIVCASGCLLVLMFLLISGFPVSSVRAGIMLCIMFIANMFSEKRDSFTSLFASAFIILLFNPYEIASLSLELSFLATLGIIAVSNSSPVLKKPISGVFGYVYEYIAIPVRFTLSSIVFTLPVTLTSFGTVSVISPISSVAVSLIFPLYLSFSYAFCFLSLIFPPASELVSKAVVFFAGIFEKTVEFLSSFRYSSVATGSGTGVFLLVISLICISLMLVLKKKYFVFLFYSSVCVMTLGVALHIILTSFAGSNIFFYNASDGYAMIAVSDGECVYIDDGNCDSYNSLITRSGKTYCDIAVFRTVDSSAVSKSAYFIECMGVKTIYLLENDAEAELEYLDEISVLANANGCDIIYKSDFSFDTGGISVVLTGCATEIGYGNSYFCFADGEIPEDIEKREKIIIPLCNSSLAKAYGNAFTYPAGSFINLLEQEE